MSSSYNKWSNLKLEGNGTGGIELRVAGGNGGKIGLNCSQNSHGVTIHSPPHAANATYTISTTYNWRGRYSRQLLSSRRR